MGVTVWDLAGFKDICHGVLGAVYALILASTFPTPAYMKSAFKR